VASIRYYKCTKCGKQAGTGKLLDVLLGFPKSIPNCASCGGSNELRMIPPFALGAGAHEYTVLDAFHEELSWPHGGNKVLFYPFLVILEYTDGNGRTVWLPYWHIYGTKAKFGERAPWMDIDLFEGLLAQARAKGYCPTGCELQPGHASKASITKPW